MSSVIRPRSLWERIVYPFRRGPDRQGRPMGFFTDTSVCIGCKACQVACKQSNLLPGEEPELSGHSYDNTMRLTARTWRHVAFVELPPTPAEDVLMDDGSPDFPNGEPTARPSAGPSGGPDMGPLTGLITDSAIRPTTRPTTGATAEPTVGSDRGSATGADTESATGPVVESAGGRTGAGKEVGSQAGRAPGAVPKTGSATEPTTRSTTGTTGGATARSDRESAIGPMGGPESQEPHAGAGEGSGPQPGREPLAESGVFSDSLPGQALPGASGWGTRFEAELKAEAEREPVPGWAAGRMRWLFSSDSCKHCADPPCLRACPTGALVRTEYGGVYPQTDICNGCASCVAACPFGVVDLDAASGHSHKCTFCLDRVRDGLVPACAKTCPTRSIQYGPLDELRRTARSRLKALRAQGVVRARLYGLDPTATYPALHNIFLLQDEPTLYGLPAEPIHPALRLYGDYLRAALGLAFALGLVLYSLSLGGAL